MQFRYTFDLDYRKGFSLTIVRQYFEDFIRLGADQCSWTEAGTTDKQQQRPSLLNDRYKLYLRHYSEGILETVMFFIPLARKSYGSRPMTTMLKTGSKLQLQDLAIFGQAARIC